MRDALVVVVQIQDEAVEICDQRQMQGQARLVGVLAAGARLRPSGPMTAAAAARLKLRPVYTRLAEFTLQAS